MYKIISTIILSIFITSTPLSALLFIERADIHFKIRNDRRAYQKAVAFKRAIEKKMPNLYIRRDKDRKKAVNEGVNLSFLPIGLYGTSTVPLDSIPHKTHPMHLSVPNDPQIVNHARHWQYYKVSITNAGISSLKESDYYNCLADCKGKYKGLPHPKYLTLRDYLRMFDPEIKQAKAEVYLTLVGHVSLRSPNVATVEGERMYDMKEGRTNISLFFADHLTFDEKVAGRKIIDDLLVKKTTSKTVRVYGRFIGDTSTPRENQKFQALEVVSVEPPMLEGKLVSIGGTGGLKGQQVSIRSDFWHDKGFWWKKIDGVPVKWDMKNNKPLQIP